MIDDPDIRTLRREYAVLAVDGAITQASAAARFLELGDDKFAIAAFQRCVDFIKLAAGEINTLRAAAPNPPPISTMEGGA